MQKNEAQKKSKKKRPELRMWHLSKFFIHFLKVAISLIFIHCANYKAKVCQQNLPPALVKYPENCFDSTNGTKNAAISLFLLICPMLMHEFLFLIMKFLWAATDVIHVFTTNENKRSSGQSYKQFMLIIYE